MDQGEPGGGHLMELLTVAETAELLRVSPSMVRKILKTSGLGHLRIGTRVVIPQKSLEEFIELHTVKIGGTKK